MDVEIDVINRDIRQVISVESLPSVGDFIADPETGELGHLIVRRVVANGDGTSRIEAVHVSNDDDLAAHGTPLMIFLAEIGLTVAI